MTSPTTNTATDPAVQALADAGWLGTWDDPITLDDLADAVRIVLNTAGTPDRTEWCCATTRDADGAVRRQVTDDEAYAEMMADSMATYLAKESETVAVIVAGTGPAVESRQVRVCADGTTILGPWRHVRDGRPITED